MGLFKKIPTTPTNNECGPEPELSANDLLKMCLEDLGCEYSLDDDVFEVTYQGEHLIIYGGEDVKFIMIRDPWWYDVDINDLTAVSLVRRAINQCNIMGRYTLIYSMDMENNKMGVHTQMNALFIKEIPAIQHYLRTIFDIVLHSHHDFYSTMEKIRQEEYSKNN